MERTRGKNRRMLIVYDLVIYAMTAVLLLVFYQGNENLSAMGVLQQVVLSVACIFSARIVGGVYKQIWRYGGIQSYMRMMLTDAIGFVMYLFLEITTVVNRITFGRMLSLCCVNLLGALAIRMVYRYAYKCASDDTRLGRVLSVLLYATSGLTSTSSDTKKIKVAIIGAGRLGTSLAEELAGSETSAYTPRCFIDNNPDKIGRQIQGLPVLADDDDTLALIAKYEVQEIIFAIPHMSEERKIALYEYYKKAGYKLKIYDQPLVDEADSHKHIRDIEISDLLFRTQQLVVDEETKGYYEGKRILITGGGGSIGSELCRQLAAMNPKSIVILDIYENGAYDVQQELKILYDGTLDLKIEICSITNRRALKKVFARHRPQIVINAAAHKHVPLMETNAIEAIQNNVFGTANLIDMSEAFGVEHFLMVSTDKAVNPTNVMGATKRMCEMLVQSASTYGRVRYSATRFGNVLGSAGSVIPLFKRQIQSGGPVTVTDSRIIRYFMTIQEASGLVLKSGQLASSGDLFVLDMGEPVSIMELARKMVRLSGEDIQIVETGLRPGEKLYEEVLVRTDELDRTAHDMIFREREATLSRKTISSKLQILYKVCMEGDDAQAREALKSVVPTYKSPAEVNAKIASTKVASARREEPITATAIEARDLTSLLDEKLELRTESLEERTESLERKTEGLDESLELRTESLGERTRSADESLELRTESLESRMESSEIRTEHLEDRMERLEGRTESLEKSLQQVHDPMASFSDEEKEIILEKARETTIDLDRRRTKRA